MVRIFRLVSNRHALVGQKWRQWRARKRLHSKQLVYITMHWLPSHVTADPYPIWCTEYGCSLELDVVI